MFFLKSDIIISSSTSGFYMSHLVILLSSLVSFAKGFQTKSYYSFARRPFSNLAAGNVKIEDILKAPVWPEKWPFYPEDFKRQDESDDSQFYESPRLVYHIDEGITWNTYSPNSSIAVINSLKCCNNLHTSIKGAVRSLTNYYRQTFQSGNDVLDICSSWVSHFPDDVKLVGLGMNRKELIQNKQLDDFVVQNLNQNPLFPFPKETFDVVTCVVSVDYLTRPLEVFSEIR
jgi:Methyltransferase domain